MKRIYIYIRVHTCQIVCQNGETATRQAHQHRQPTIQQFFYSVLDMLIPQHHYNPQAFPADQIEFAGICLSWDKEKCCSHFCFDLGM